MQVQRFQAQCFRNLTQIELTPCPGINVIYGKNGQGKTSLLEGLWLFTGCQSFRSHETRELIQTGTPRATLEMCFCLEAEEQDLGWARTARLELNRTEKRRNLWLDGLPQESPRRLLGLVPAVVFTPGSLALTQGAPSERRRFLDIALSMRRPSYAVQLSKTLKILAQRNALLRSPHLRPEDLMSWDVPLSHAALLLLEARRAYTQQLFPRAERIYQTLSAGQETLSLTYQHCEADSAEAFLELLQRAQELDQRRRTTSVGPHRDDLICLLDGRPLREYGSQGQQRTAALALKLAEATLLQETFGEPPVIFLDDVLSELDATRQRELFQYLGDWQVFLTCCEFIPALKPLASNILDLKQLKT